MTTTISNGSATITPELVLGYETSRRTLNREHVSLSGRVNVTIGSVLPRRGTLTLLFASEADAVAAVALFVSPVAMTLTTDELSSIGMVFVLQDSAEIGWRLDDQTLTRWIVEVPYQELS